MWRFNGRWNGCISCKGTSVDSQDITIIVGLSYGQHRAEWESNKLLIHGMLKLLPYFQRGITDVQVEQTLGGHTVHLVSKQFPYIFEGERFYLFGVVLILLWNTLVYIFLASLGSAIPVLRVSTKEANTLLFNMKAIKAFKQPFTLLNYHSVWKWFSKPVNLHKYPFGSRKCSNLLALTANLTPIGWHEPF